MTYSPGASLVVLAGDVEGREAIGGPSAGHGVHLGFGRIVALEIEVPNLLANLL